MLTYSNRNRCNRHKGLAHLMGLSLARMPSSPRPRRRLHHREPLVHLHFLLRRTLPEQLRQQVLALDISHRNIWLCCDSKSRPLSFLAKMPEFLSQCNKPSLHSANVDRLRQPSNRLKLHPRQPHKAIRMQPRPDPIPGMLSKPSQARQWRILSSQSSSHGVSRTGFC